MNECDVPHCEKCPVKGKCSKCAAGRHLSTMQTCIATCPPGEVFDNAQGNCIPCDGQVVHHADGNSSCVECPNGHVQVIGQDECQNIQDTCTPDQCQTCQECLQKAKPKVARCMLRKRKYTRSCLNFDEVWCHKFWGYLNNCAGFSMGCFFKLMCHEPCICPEWKAVRCGGDQSGDPSECKANRLGSLLEGNYSVHTTKLGRSEAATEVDAGVEYDAEAGSLDSTLSGKRTCL